jgi:succinate dehydrogenase hydrophobic anchor subunit
MLQLITNYLRKHRLKSMLQLITNYLQKHRLKSMLQLVFQLIIFPALQTYASICL